jgi:predicted amidohydrolase
MRVAALQFFATPFAQQRNLAAAERLARSAAAQGARLIVLPEVFNTGYVYAPRLPSAAEPPNGPTFQWLTRLSTELNALIGGTWLMQEHGRVVNAFVLVEPSGRAHIYHKRHPFVWERCYFEPGRTPLIAETALGRIGLMTCWDIAHRDTWAAYAGQMEVLLIASAPPRFHRAVLNFPAGQKIYLAQLLPELLHHREAIDRWYLEDVAANAPRLGAPIVHAVMAGRFVSALPFPRLSFAGAAATHPRWWPLVAQAPQATVRATFYGTSAVMSATGAVLARVTEEEGVALADVEPGPRKPLAPLPAGRYLLPHIPARLTLLDKLMAMLNSV